MNKLIAIEIAVIVAGVMLAIWHPLAAVTWFVGYMVGFHKRGLEMRPKVTNG